MSAKSDAMRMSEPEWDYWEFGRQFGGALIGHDVVDRVDPALVEAIGFHSSAPMRRAAADMASAMSAFSDVMRSTGDAFATLLARMPAPAMPYKRNKHFGYGR